MSLMRRASWIAKQLEIDNVDDVHDALLGNITRPWAFVQEIESLSREYDSILSKVEKNNER